MCQLKLEHNSERFEILASFKPDSLITATTHGLVAEPLLHYRRHARGTFEIILKAGMEHFQERLGFLFLEFQGQTTCEIVFGAVGAELEMSNIRRCVPPSEFYPITHSC